MVITGNRQYTAELRRTGSVGVTEHIAATVDARTFAVPHAEHAVIGGAFKDVDLLCAPDRRGGKVFVHAWMEHRVVLLEIVPGLPQCLVETTQRRAAVAGNEPGGVQAIGQIALALHQGQTHQRLNPGE
ncbi:hypothetical protein D3C84_240940 [compost metagenome]